MRALTAVDPAPHAPIPAATAPARRRPRARPALVVVLLVLALHAVLITRLAPVDTVGNTPVAASRRPVVMVVVPMPMPVPVPIQAPIQAPMQVPSPPAPARVPSLPPALHTQTPAAAPTATPAAAVRAAPPPAAATARGAAAPPVSAAAADPDDAADASTANTPAAIGTAPPLYPTQMPSPTTLRYAVRLPNQAGVASLAWLHDGQRYQLQLDSRNSAGQPLLEQLSQGLLDSTGLAPERFTDRRRGRGWRAANFRRDLGRISFSGPPVDYPAWPGAQDRLSWLVQLVAIQAAAVAAGQPLQPVRLFVVDARGGAALLRFEPITATADEAALQHWQHQPLLVDTAGGVDRHDAQRIDLWLDPALGHWPARLRYTALRSGDQTEWLHLPGPPQPP